MAGLRDPVVPGETASRRMADAQRAFRAQPAQGRSLNEMRKGGKVTLKKHAASEARQKGKRNAKGRT